jgi:hypothetical protein
MAVVLHAFTTVKRKIEELLIKAAMQNEENLNTLRLVLLHIKYKFKPVHNGCVEVM